MSKGWNRKLPSLRSWKLVNFKSVVQADISLAPLTLVVGANSAGKSTLLQSILLMAQATGQRTPGTFSLNGTLVGLGTYAEAHSDFDGCDSELMTIAGSVSMPYPLGRPYMFYGRGDDLENSSGQGNEDNLVSWRVDLCSDPDSSGALVDNAEVNLFCGNELMGKLEASARVGESEAPPMLESQHSFFGDRYVMTEHLKERTAGERASDALRFWRMSAGPSVDKDYGAVSFEAGIPVNGLIETDEITWFLDLVKREAVEIGVFGDESHSKESDGKESSELKEPEALEQLYVLLKARCLHIVDARRQGVAAGLELKSADSSLLHSLIERADYSEKLYPKLKNRLDRDVDGSRVILVPRYERGMGMRDIAVEVPEFLSGNVLYLGPLREDPRVSYPHAIAGSTHMPLGRKGESTASFLLQNTSGRRSAPVGAGLPYRRFMGPPRFPLPGGGTERSLESAVNAWISNFGLGESLGVQDQARYGVGFTIDKRDLTSVGTGVSQVLPVLVLCLVAQPGQLILLEQPELHLNPALQQHLADFFLEIVKSGRQLIVETHSEYMVTRLRRRVAEDSSGDVRNLFNFVFAEQDNRRRTNFLVLDVAESGALDAKEWPDGFFDQAGSDVEAIMKAALGRRRRKSD